MTRVDPALTLAQWFSPGFPVGSFAYSHGLEWLIDAQRLTGAADLHDWIAALLTDGTGRTDAFFLSTAYDAEPAEVAALNDLCLAFCGSRGRRVESEEQGAAFARALREMGHPVEDLCYPVAVGRAARACDLPLPLTLRFYLQAFAANLVSAAVRRVPLGQSAGQRVLADLAPVVQRVADKTPGLTAQDLYTNTLAAEIAAMEHETLRTRVFRT